MKKIMMVLLVVCGFVTDIFAQMTFGNTGLVNIPTADMQKEGTFLGGATFLPKRYMSNDFYYNTGIYYFGLTPLPWVEVTMRETLLYRRKVYDEGYLGGWGYYQQDRSYSVRLRPLMEKEGRWWPSLVIGSNDPWSDHGGSYYSCVYGVLTKHVKFENVGDFGITAGYFYSIHDDDGFGTEKVYNGTFGGVSFTPSFWNKMMILADYDTRGINLGVNVCLFNHWNILAYGRDMKRFGLGMSYQYTIDW
ncbi:MAG: YjbH domain-containing protein [Bacteroidaceae bacterium]|nr:YjbH domain-containing protein [Bacteroidaceae bacterium]